MIERSTLPATPGVAVKMFSTTFCAYCVRAKLLLGKRGIPYEDVNVGRDWEARRWLVEVSGGRKTVPVIFVRGEHIGGFEELRDLDRAGKLEGLYGAATT
jgi:glutaredoxin 3